MAVAAAISKTYQSLDLGGFAAETQLPGVTRGSTWPRREPKGWSCCAASPRATEPLSSRPRLGTGVRGKPLGPSGPPPRRCRWPRKRSSTAARRRRPKLVMSLSSSRSCERRRRRPGRGRGRGRSVVLARKTAICPAAARFSGQRSLPGDDAASRGATRRRDSSPRRPSRSPSRRSSARTRASGCLTLRPQRGRRRRS
jgi:hypothetical protein